MRRTLIAAGAMVAACVAASGEARAQYWLSDRNLSEGRGIRLGNFELHPGIGAEFGYDSNTYARPDNPPAGDNPARQVSRSVGDIGPAWGSGENPRTTWRCPPGTERVGALGGLSGLERALQRSPPLRGDISCCLWRKPSTTVEVLFVVALSLSVENHE